MPFSSFTGVLVFSVASTWGVIRIVLGGGRPLDCTVP